MSPSATTATLTTAANPVSAVTPSVTATSATTAPTVAATIPVDPIQIALSADGTRLYGTGIANSSGTPTATVQVVDTVTNTQVGSPIPVGNFPISVVTNSATNRTYVTVGTPNPNSPGAFSESLVVIDNTTNTVVGATPVGLTTGGIANTVPSPVMGAAPIFNQQLAADLAVSPDGTRVYVIDNVLGFNQANPYASTFQPTLWVFNTTTDTPTPVGSPIALAPPTSPYQNPSGTAWSGQILMSPSGDRIYASTYTQSFAQQPYTETIHTIDRATGAVIGAPIVVPNSASQYTTGSMALSADGTKLYVETAPQSTTGTSQSQSAQDFTNATVLTFDTATGQQIGTPIDVVGYGALAITPDGKTLYVADVADLRTGKTATYQMTPSGPSPQTVSETLYEGSVTAYNTATGKQIGDPVTVGLVPTAITINSAGTHVYVANSGDNTVSVINIAPASAGGGPNILQALFISLQTWSNNLGQGAQAWLTSLANATQNWFAQLTTSTLRFIDQIVSPPPPPPPAQGPHSTTDLWTTLLAHTTTTTGNGDGVATEIVTVNGQDKLIVYLGGSTLNLGDQFAADNIGSIQGNVKSQQINDINNALRYEPAGTPIMLVGYSQGGMDAMNIAAHASQYNLNVDAVVTFGAPIIQPPPATPTPTGGYYIINLEDMSDPISTLNPAIYGQRNNTPSSDIFIGTSSNDWNYAVGQTAGGITGGIAGFIVGLRTGNPIGGARVGAQAGAFAGGTAGGLAVHGNPSTYAQVSTQFDKSNASKYSEVKCAIRQFYGDVVIGP